MWPDFRRTLSATCRTKGSGNAWAELETLKPSPGAQRRTCGLEAASSKAFQWAYADIRRWARLLAAGILPQKLIFSKIGVSGQVTLPCPSILETSSVISCASSSPV